MLSFRIPHAGIKIFCARSSKAAQIKQYVFFYTVKIYVRQYATINTFSIWYKIIVFRIKALVLRWLGARQRFYLLRRIRRDSASTNNIVLGYFYISLISSSSCFLQIKVPIPEKMNVKIKAAWA